ncbi:MAG: DUF5050 domain-containing protein [Firmicutes bacterium]|nr:DUF5050 domain-containing protein [Bacillota bacterium]
MATVLPTLEGYNIETILSNTPFYTNYRASSANRDSGEDYSYIITEFNPSFMVRRIESGALEVTERFLIEYETAFERFVKLGESFKALKEQFVAPIEEFVQTNNTAYIIRVMGRYGGINDNFPNERMDFNDAYVLLRPLLQSLVAANKAGLFFQYEEDSFGVNHYSQLMLDSMFSWEEDPLTSVIATVKLFYRFISGYEHASSGSPSIDDLALPPRLTKTFKEVLEGEPTYGSLDDFGKQLRTVMEAEGRKDIIEKAKVYKPSKPVKKLMAVGIIAAVAVVMLAFITIPFILIFSAINEYNEGEEEAPLETFVVAPILPTTFLRLHSGYAITDPRDPTIMLNGAFFQQAGSLYFRSSQGGGTLSRQSAIGTDTVLATNVRPAFITSHGNYIYFSDGLEDYHIRRVHMTGGDAETIVENTASFLNVSSNFLFFTNHDDRDFLYRVDLNTLAMEPFLRLATYETIIYAGQIYFVNGSGNFRIYTVPENNPNAPPERLNNSNSDNLRISDGYIFYRDLATSTIHRMTLSGLEVSAPIIPFAVASFDINGHTMAVIEEHSQMVWIYNTATGSLESTGTMASYLSAGNNMAYIIDYNDSTINRLAELAYQYQVNGEFDETGETDENGETAEQNETEEIAETEEIPTFDEPLIDEELLYLLDDLEDAEETE